MKTPKKLLLSILSLCLIGYANAQETSKPTTYGKNIISIAPIQFTNTSIKGVGIQYERVLDNKGIFSFSLPMALSYNSYEAASEFWMYPGLKIYPTGSNRKVSYAVGPSLAIATGKGPSYVNDDLENIFQVGIIVNNSLNIQPTPKLYLGLELGLGIPYIENIYASDNYYGWPLVQFNFKIGYRF